MSDACLVVAGIEICASGGSATAVASDVDLGAYITVPWSVLFPSQFETVGATQLHLRAFENTRITSVTILLMFKFFVHHVSQFANHFRRFHLRQNAN
jgi:hypothetical protein